MREGGGATPVEVCGEACEVFERYVREGGVAVKPQSCEACEVFER